LALVLLPSGPKGLQQYIDTVRQGKGQNPKQYSARYICSLVGDFHRTLLYGGENVALVDVPVALPHCDCVSLLPLDIPYVFGQPISQCGAAVSAH
jgi:hypothetical protein